MSSLVSLEEVQDFFFEGALQCYAGDSVSSLELSGYERLHYIRGDFRMVDQWTKTSGSNKSAGTTTIFFRDTPVWWMSYGGWYEEAALPFLKKALYAAYEQRAFFGGRGPEHYGDEGRTYMNIVKQSSFEAFKGYETIVDSSISKRFGFHNYFGMSLL